MLVSISVPAPVCVKAPLVPLMTAEMVQDEGARLLLNVTAPPRGMLLEPEIVTEEGVLVTSSVVFVLMIGRSLAKEIVPPLPRVQEIVLAPP